METMSIEATASLIEHTLLSDMDEPVVAECFNCYLII